MKVFLLTAATILACAGSILAQNQPPDYRWEVGVNGGLSTFTRPLGPATGYQGTRTNISTDYSVRATYLLSPHWMLDLNIGTRKWLSYSQWKQNDMYGVALQPRDITFQVADQALTETVGLNYVLPFSDQYGRFVRSSLNFGVSFGMVNTVNDGSIEYSKYKLAPAPNYTYVSKYDYGYGIGLTYGLQMGYTYYIIPRFGINVDLAMHYAEIKTNDIRYSHENTSFRTLYFPETIGLRYRF